MEKLFCIMLFIVGIASLSGVYSASECPNSTPDMEVIKLIPCASAAQDSKAEVSKGCCSQVKILGQNPKCLCAVMLSDTAKSSGVKPEIAITIPKRCNLADRPVGFKCGAYTCLKIAWRKWQSNPVTSGGFCLRSVSCVSCATFSK